MSVLNGDTRLTEENVEKLVAHAMYLNGDVTQGSPDYEAVAARLENDDFPEDGLVVETVMAQVLFNKERVEEVRDDVIALLDQLPSKFKENEGGGWSISQLHLTNDGTEWVEELDGKLDMLLSLGFAIGKLRWILPRDLWHILPDQYPYVTVMEEATEYNAKALGEEDGFFNQYMPEGD